MHLTDREAAWLGGSSGKAHQLAMRLLVAAGEATGASTFVPIEFAHINSCHYSGQLSVDFAEYLLAEGATLAVPTHTNASLIDQHCPDLRPMERFTTEVAGAQRLMEIYEELGCSAMWSCAPYQEHAGRPEFGQQIVGSESNAVSFFNSALGARTNKYGDMLDISAAVVGRVPLSGLHTDAGRLATHEVAVELDDAVIDDPMLPHLLGILIGQTVGTSIPVISGMGRVDEDGVKAMAAAAATSGGVEMFHIAGVTPEAPTLHDALGGRPARERTTVDSDALQTVRSQLSARSSGPVDAICLGTPHFSITEFAALQSALDGRPISPTVTMLVTTSRAVLAELQLRGWDTSLTESGVQIVLDTCTYYPPRASGVQGTVMTNSAKWAYYAPGMLDVHVAFGRLADCVESAVRGEVTVAGDWDAL